MRKPPVIFICHSSRDKTFVRGLVTRLRADGIEVWLDELEVRIGDSIHQKINDGLKRSDFVAVVLSTASVSSKWVQEELSSASSLEKYSDRGIIVLPILIEECEIPPLLLDRRYANFKDDAESAYQELVDSIRHHFEKSHPDIDVSGLAILELNPLLFQAAADDPDLLKRLAPRHFEELVALLLQKAGYIVHLTTTTQDGGFDILAVRPFPLPDGAGEDMLVQCKRYSRPIGISEVYQLIGVRARAGASSAMLVTTSKFTRPAIEAAKRGNIHLVDGEQISKWLAQFWPGGSAQNTAG